MEDWQHSRCYVPEMGTTALTGFMQQLHEGWALGAMAELVDNALEVGAKRLDIKLVTPDSEDHQLVLTDDGIGLDRPALERMLRLGSDTEKVKTNNNYGVGFKSGSLGIGHSVVVFTKSRECSRHVGKSDAERLECHEKCTEPKVLIRGVTVLSTKLINPRIMIPTILWLPNGNPITNETHVPYEAARSDGRDGQSTVMLNELKTKSVESLLHQISHSCQMDTPAIQSHFESIGTETGTRIVVFMDRHNPLFRNEGGDIEIVGTKRRSDRPANLLIDFSALAYLELIYRKLDGMAMTLNSKTVVVPWTIEDRLWGKFTKQVKITHRIFRKGELTDSRKESTLAVTLGFSPNDCDLGACGFFIYFMNVQAQTRRLVQSYYRPAASFMAGSGFGNGDKRGAVDGMVGVIELDDSMVKVDNGKQKFSGVDFMKELDIELGKCVTEYNDHIDFKEHKWKHETIGGDLSVEYSVQKGEACWCKFDKKKFRFSGWPGWLMDRHDRIDTRNVPKEVFEDSKAKDFQSQLVQVFPIQTGGRGNQEYYWGKPGEIEIFTPGNKSSKRGPSKDDRALLAAFDKAVKEAEKWYERVMVKEKQGQVVSTTVAPHPAVPESSGLLQVQCRKCTASRTIEAEPEKLAKYTNSLEPWDCMMGFLVDGKHTFGCDMTPTASGSSSTSAGASMSTPNPHTGIEALSDQLKSLLNPDGIFSNCKLMPKLMQLLTGAQTVKERELMCTVLTRSTSESSRQKFLEKGGLQAVPLPMPCTRPSPPRPPRSPPQPLCHPKADICVQSTTCSWAEDSMLLSGVRRACMFGVARDVHTRGLCFSEVLLELETFFDDCGWA